MLRSVQQLVEHALTGNPNTKRIGNHWCMRPRNMFYEFYYFNTCVCAADTAHLLVMFDNGGWGTSSTTRTINSYRNAFTGFHEVSKQELYERSRSHE